MKEFRLNKLAREKYGFKEVFFSLNGDVIFENFYAARKFAEYLNTKRDLIRFPELAANPAELNLIGLLHEIYHKIFERYQEMVEANIIEEAYQYLEKTFPKEALDAFFIHFIEEFPPQEVYTKQMTAQEYYDQEDSVIPVKELLIEELILIWLSNNNSAYAKYKELFSDKELQTHEFMYQDIIIELQEFLKLQPTIGPKHSYLHEFLMEPQKQYPSSLKGQLEYIINNWGFIIGDYLSQLLSSYDFLKETEKIGVIEPVESKVLSYQGLEDTENYSEDKEWMPNVVLLAKNTYVWLAQLSKKYNRPITRLDDIPVEEFQQLREWGFTGLWLIGVWERSPASKRIKHLSGNQDAEASAYSLYDYEIAKDLGGYEAYKKLKDLASMHGIYLATDMVPNHTGIVSKWILEHPDRFIWLPEPPFPTYTFNGENLSTDPNVQVYLEDHYYDRTDAAVVFKRVDVNTGETRYIYHGNDGTSMPWNDTAQLNYLNPETREAVIQTILKVAKMFPIIRFDAAMTLTKFHYQRLWFPEPGTGGDIPSRAEYGLTREEFNKHMPKEFWREVVDRVAQEAPDTLLLAEAFWLLEGYFVRNLGMHRVYNSAFMNMLKNEENAKFKQTIKNTLEFDPQILKRFVNFMSNPDEDPAVLQFGKGDKYFGVAVMLVTMPGLPMFAHGQIYGFREKYGMEYKHPYLDEAVDEDLLNRHKEEIFPLMKQRSLFSDVKNFYFYEVFTSRGDPLNDVIAYSNQKGNEKALIIYHNKFSDVRGWVKETVWYKGERNGEKTLMKKSLGEALNIPNQPKTFVIFKDKIANLEYIRSASELHQKGLYIILGAYKYHVFQDFRIITDNAWDHYRQLHEFLGGKGVPDINLALQELFLQPVHQAFTKLMTPTLIQNTYSAYRDDRDLESFKATIQNQMQTPLLTFITTVKDYVGSQKNPQDLIDEICSLIQTMFLIRLEGNQAQTRGHESHEEEFYDINSLHDWAVFLFWAVLHNLGKLKQDSSYEELSRTWIDEFFIGKTIHWILEKISTPTPQDDVLLLKVLIGKQNWLTKTLYSKEYTPYTILRSFLEDIEFQASINLHRYNGILYFNKESYENAILWLFKIGLLTTRIQQSWKAPGDTIFQQARTYLNILLTQHVKAQYQIERLLSLLSEHPM